MSRPAMLHEERVRLAVRSACDCGGMGRGRPCAPTCIGAHAEDALDQLLEQRAQPREIVLLVAPAVAVLSRVREVAPSIRAELAEVERRILEIGQRLASAPESGTATP